MDLARFSFVAIAGLLLASHVHAQAPKRQFSEADVAARNLMSDCAVIWSVKDRQDLKDAEEDLRDTLRTTIEVYTQARQQQAQAVAQAEQEVERMNDALAGASFAEGEAWERAEGKGLISKQRAMAIGTTLWQGVNRAGRAEAEAKLEQQRNILKGINRRMIGWYAYAVGMNECLTDQKAYLEKTNPNSPMRGPNDERPLGGPANTASIQKAQGTVSGTWSGFCRSGDITVPVNGLFSMKIDAQRNITAAFVDGAAATVKGSMQSGGQVNATGTVVLGAEMRVFVTMTGQMSWNGAGALQGRGTFTSRDGESMRCTGGWSGG